MSLKDVSLGFFAANVQVVALLIRRISSSVPATLASWTPRAGDPLRSERGHRRYSRTDEAGGDAVPSADTEEQRAQGVPSVRKAAER
ncbi:hypothetical protein ACGFX2_33535 [Streptomyces goshikiensis]|uniref:hypothetical protein n=1 Tax=Streptomyces goshikiensis TaxID=1942 RepID=UPI003710E427